MLEYNCFFLYAFQDYCDSVFNALFMMIKLIFFFELYILMALLFPIFLFQGVSQAPPTGGADILLDLLSIGTPSPVSALNTVPTSQDNMSSVSPLEALSTLPSPVSSAQVSQRSMLASVKGTIDQSKQPSGVAPVMDLLDGLSSNPLALGIEVLNVQCTVYTSLLFLHWFGSGIY